VSRRHAEERRKLNRLRRELEYARQELAPGYCDRCDRPLARPNWVLVVEPADDEDDGT
jgi:hypothetical protein